MQIRERDKKGILLELELRFQAIERKQEGLRIKIDEVKNDLEKSRLRD